MSRRSLWLVLGDLASYTLATLLGFASHAALQIEALGRMLATLVPFSLAWLILAFVLGAFDPDSASQPRELWRPALAAIYAAPLGAWLRGLWLGVPILPVFVALMAGVTLVLLLAWRSAFVILSKRGS